MTLIYRIILGSNANFDEKFNWYIFFACLLVDSFNISVLVWWIISSMLANR